MSYICIIMFPILSTIPSTRIDDIPAERSRQVLFIYRKGTSRCSYLGGSR